MSQNELFFFAHLVEFVVVSIAGGAIALIAIWIIGPPRLQSLGKVTPECNAPAWQQEKAA